jgi:hypothetical protein
MHLQPHVRKAHRRFVRVRHQLHGARQRFDRLVSKRIAITARARRPFGVRHGDRRCRRFRLKFVERPAHELQRPVICKKQIGVSSWRAFYTSSVTVRLAVWLVGSKSKRCVRQTLTRAKDEFPAVIGNRLCRTGTLSFVVDAEDGWRPE